MCNCVTLDGYDEYYTSSHFGAGIGPIHLNQLDCSGAEYRVVDCQSEESSSYSHYSDWSITCKNGI